MNKERIAFLHQQYLTDQLTLEEREEWFSVLQNPRAKQYLQELVYHTWDEMNKTDGIALRDNRATEILQEIIAQRPKKQKTNRLPFIYRRLAAAASVLLVLTTGIWLFHFFSNKNNVHNTAYQSVEIAPGKLGATLTLSNGKQIKLNEATTGQLAKEAGVSIKKTNEGQLIYEITDRNIDADQTNTLSTNKGETYQVQLPDGTRIWLNAASSIKYKANLSKQNERKVYLSGEAYFEVAKDKKHPFIVNTGTQEVKVLGTHFNINAYEDEDKITTTLIEGLVQISPQKNQVNSSVSPILLHPGEQASYQQGEISINKVDAENSIAWKKGVFVFQNENIASVMRKISRWYDVNVIYEDESLQNIPLEGSITRFTNISKILKMIELTKLVKFKIEGKTVFIYSPPKQP